MSWQDRYQLQREPAHTLRLMTRGDIPSAVALVERAGWQHQATDLERLLHWSPDGCFVIADVDGAILGTVSTTPYGTALAWIGMLLVAPDSRRQGLGRRLMRAALDHLIARGTERIMLDATDAGRPLYRALGFRELVQVDRWQGRASTYLGPRARRALPVHRHAVLALDRALFGLDRSHIVQRLWDESPELAWVDIQQGEAQGYLLGRRVRQGVALGPWMSRNAPAAERLLLSALEQLQGEEVVMHIPDNNGRSTILARDHNLRRERRCIRMIYGEAQPVQGELLAELAIASLATG